MIDAPNLPIMRGPAPLAARSGLVLHKSTHFFFWSDYDRNSEFRITQMFTLAVKPQKNENVQKSTSGQQPNASYTCRVNNSQLFSVKCDHFDLLVKSMNNTIGRVDR